MQISRLVRTPGDLALQPNKSAEDTSHEQTTDGAVHHHDLLKAIEAEGLREMDN
jgi:hypothetical protein